MLITSTPLLVGLLCSISCTTYPSISLEGKNMWIMKMLPVDSKYIFLSKIMVNLTIQLPIILLSLVIFSISLSLNFINIFFLMLIPVLDSLFIAMFGLIVNLNYYDLNFTNEIKPIKQSFSAFITVMVGILINIVPLLINISVSKEIFFLIISIVMIIINIICYMYLHFKGPEKFLKI